MPERPEGVICHLTANRVRIRIPERRYDQAFFEAVHDLLSKWQSVERVEVNPLTASVLVHYSDGPGLFLENVTHNDLFALVKPESDDWPAAFPSGTVRGEPLTRQARRGVTAVDRRLTLLSGGRGDLRSLVFLGLLGTGLVQLLRGNVVAPAVTLLWYAGDVLGLWRRDDAGKSASSGAEPRA